MLLIHFCLSKIRTKITFVFLGIAIIFYYSKNSRYSIFLLNLMREILNLYGAVKKY